MKTLEFIEIVSYEWHCPPQKCMELKDLYTEKQKEKQKQDYKIKHGEEAWKEHMEKVGDKQILGPGNIELVELNLPRMWQKIKKIIQQARLVTDMGGSDAISQGLMAARLHPKQKKQSRHAKQDSKKPHKRFNQLTQALGDKEAQAPVESLLPTSQGVLHIESPGKLVAQTLGSSSAVAAKPSDDVGGEPAPKNAKKAGTVSSTVVDAAPKDAVNKNKHK